MAHVHSRPRMIVALAGATALALAVTAPPVAADDDNDNGGDALVQVVQGLDGPRGVDASDAERVLYAEGDGTVSVAVLDGDPVRTRVIGQVPAGFIAPAVARGPRGRVYALTVQGAPGSGSNTLYWLRRGEAPKVVADIAAYQVGDPDPFNLADPPEESNPFGLATLPDRSVLVADAAANDLLRIFPNGEIVTVARFKPRMVTVPAGLPPELEGHPLPPAGTTVASESVPTSVTVGEDGYYYVGELRGVPGTPGTSQVWRIKPGSVGAVCDPDNPASGDCTRFADGFTAIVDLASGEDGSVYVLELVSEGWLQWELGLVDPPVGGLFRVSPNGHDVTELAVSQLVLPGGVDVTEDGTVHVTAPVFGPGSLMALGDIESDGHESEDHDQRDEVADD